MKKSIDKIIMAIAYFYILLPIMIFLLGWYVWYIAIPGTVILATCFWRICNDRDTMSFNFEWNKHDIEKAIFCVGIIALWVYFSGVGALVSQNSDHAYRNAIFEILVEYDWPVVKELLIDETIQTKGMIYYIGFWLPSAVVGKLFGVRMGYCFQTLWAFVGISLFYYLICVVRKKIEIWPLVIFIFFSGLDIWGYYIVGNDMELLNGTTHIEWWSTLFQFSSFTTQLYWVFNQAIYAWLIFMLLYVQKSNRYMVLILGCTLLSSTLPFVGMLPFFCFFVLTRQYDSCVWGRKEWRRSFGYDLFTFENILGGGVAGIFSFLYLIGNLSGQQVELTNTEVSRLGYIMTVVVFIFVEVGVWWLAIYKYHKKNSLLYMVLGWLCVCPLINVGTGGDFCMRASIPALVVLYILVLQTLESAYKKRDFLVCTFLIGLLLIGSVTPMNEINRVISDTSRKFKENECIYGKRVSDEMIFGAPNFSGDVDKGLYFRYFVKK